MKIRLSKSYRTYEVYDTIEFNPQDYPELEGMSDDEIIAYLNQNMDDFSVDGNNTLYEQFVYEGDLIRDKVFDEDYDIFKVEE